MAISGSDAVKPRFVRLFVTSPSAHEKIFVVYFFPLFPELLLVLGRIPSPCRSLSDYEEGRSDQADSDGDC
jgi:hypothetical protein